MVTPSLLDVDLDVVVLEAERVDCSAIRRYELPRVVSGVVADIVIESKLLHSTSPPNVASLRLTPSSTTLVFGREQDPVELELGRERPRSDGRCRTTGQGLSSRCRPGCWNRRRPVRAACRGPRWRRAPPWSPGAASSSGSSLPAARSVDWFAWRSARRRRGHRLRASPARSRSHRTRRRDLRPRSRRALLRVDRVRRHRGRSRRCPRGRRVARSG